LSTESWSQGCGKGFRHILPGGVGLLFDLQGQDKLTADEFAQGCGYYFALGLLYNLNTQADHYQGSRYTLGASAHQATAAFIDTGGNDHYATTGAAFCGAAWDQSSALFYDQSGNDIYDSKDFSLAAAAHNSIASFWDISGQDTFNAHILPAHISSNSYHGGKSQSYFFSRNPLFKTQIDTNKQEFIITPESKSP